MDANMEELGEHERDKGDGEEKSARGRPGTVEVQLGRSGDGDDEKDRCVELITKALGEKPWQFPGRNHGEGGVAGKDRDEGVEEDMAA